MLSSPSEPQGLTHPKSSPSVALLTSKVKGPLFTHLFALHPEFIVVHNGIITNYKELRKYLVSEKV